MTIETFSGIQHTTTIARRRLDDNAALFSENAIESRKIIQKSAQKI